MRFTTWGIDFTGGQRGNEGTWWMTIQGEEGHSHATGYGQEPRKTTNPLDLIR